MLKIRIKRKNLLKENKGDAFTKTFVKLRSMLTKKVYFEDWVEFVRRAEERLSPDELSLVDSYMANHNWTETLPTGFKAILNVLASEEFDNFSLNNPSAFDLLNKIWEAKRQHYQDSSTANGVLRMILPYFDAVTRFRGINTDSDQYSADAELERLFQQDHINKKYKIVKSDVLDRLGNRYYRLFRR